MGPVTAMKPTLDLAQCGDTLSVSEVCAVLGVSRRTWVRWQARREEPIAELEPRTYRARYSKVSVQRYLSAVRGTAMQRQLQVAS